ncbi:DUF6503 family protein [Sediminibacter sp. Hel_I_10]|uniref:DUF6503 family protein n=1 Tax=Sediminibacter sp. Hel_I_10 TaxID=1392490 RepID=UPI00047B7FD5|nr:DUF6503 family protein [Sediminibacter sp. Hel_I_10]
MKYIPFLLLVFLFCNCKEESKQKRTASNIIEQSISVCGGDLVGDAEIAFAFRDKHYTAKRSNGIFELTRNFQDTTGTVTDVLTNDGFSRQLNDKRVAVSDSMASLYSASVNSVHYFSVLPYGLNADAVQKKLLNETIINGKNYHVVEITFKQDGGGEDFEDVFMYWINTKTFTPDYLAYSYEEQDGKGFRFREAYNERYIKGIRFVDYNNYKTTSTLKSLQNFPDVFEKKQLELLSKIELTNVTVSLQ